MTDPTEMMTNRPRLRDGVACKHPGCLSHVTHPCEGCGRIAGRYPVQGTDADWKPFLASLRRGEPLACTAEQWHGGLRKAVQDYAGRMIDMHQHVYAWVALEEVRHNDAAFGSGLTL